jgi:hypothetical protein
MIVFIYNRLNAFENLSAYDNRLYYLSHFVVKLELLRKFFPNS